MTLTFNNSSSVISDLLSFLDDSPTAWHAVDNCVSKLSKEGFQELKEEDSWDLERGKAYYVVRNGSSLCAFVLPTEAPKALRIAAAHTDSPAFKLKPKAEFHKENMLMLGLEIYGAPILGSWLNRDLGIAGRIIFEDKDGNLKEDLVRLDTSPLVIPQLAIHLDRNVNESGPALNKQEHLAALAGLLEKEEGEKKKKETTFIENLIKTILPIQKLLSFDLFLYPLEKARFLGSNQELIASYRIDNLASTHAALHGLLSTKQADPHTIKMVVFWDNEEIGSNTAQGAGSPFFSHIMERISLSLKIAREEYFRLMMRSLCVSIDLSHALHPNYADKHEPRHPVLLNQGIVIKSNAQYRYASDARSSAAIIALCNQCNIPFQQHVARGDIPCGTTVGPIHASITGMPTVDIGCPQLSMHASREIMGALDHLSMCQLLNAFLKG